MFKGSEQESTTPEILAGDTEKRTEDLIKSLISFKGERGADNKAIDENAKNERLKMLAEVRKGKDKDCNKETIDLAIKKLRMILEELEDAKKEIDIE